MKLLRGLAIALLLSLVSVTAAASTSTTNYSLTKPAVNDPADEDLWGTELNSNFDTIDTKLKLGIDFVTSSKTANYTVTTSDRNKTFLGDATSAAFTFTLPAASSAGSGFTLMFKKTDSSANAVTLDGNSSETIDGSTTYALSSQYDSAILICDGSNWHITGRRTAGTSAASTSAAGIVELLDSSEFATGTDSSRALTVSLFTKSIASNGYYTLPGGLIIQWGVYAGGSNAPSISFPTAFASAAYSVTVTGYPTFTTAGTTFTVTSESTTTFVVNQRNSSTGAVRTDGFNWIAIGK